MIFLAIRTDKPTAELYLFNDSQQLSEISWPAHLKLAETLNIKIKEILNKSNIEYKDLNGLAVYEGPGSFTGLRIGMSVANALAYGLSIPIVAKGSSSWLDQSLKALQKGQTDIISTPKYGSPAHITKPKN